MTALENLLRTGVRSSPQSVARGNDVNGLTMRRLRQVHQYVGMVFAPAIVFFAFSGALQTFSLHENHGGGPYRPPAWIVAIASLHKDQALPRPKAHAALNAEPTKGGSADHAEAKPKPPQPDGAPSPAKGPSPLPLKIFVLCLAIGLIGSTSVGVFIGLMNKSARRGSLIALAVGVLLPLVLIWV